MEKKTVYRCPDCYVAVKTRGEIWTCPKCYESGKLRQLTHCLNVFDGWLCNRPPGHDGCHEVLDGTRVFKSWWDDSTRGASEKLEAFDKARSESPVVACVTPQLLDKMQAAKTPDLLPCPFCGGEACVRRGEDGRYIACTECDVATRFMAQNLAGEKAAAIAWNTRAKPAIGCSDAVADQLYSMDAKLAAKDAEIARLRKLNDSLVGHVRDVARQLRPQEDIAEGLAKRMDEITGYKPPRRGPVIVCQGDDPEDLP